MSRVEDNERTVNNFITNLNQVGDQGMTALIFNSPDVARSIIDMAETDVILDISKSLAVIADSMSYIVEEESQCKKEREEKWKDKEMPSYLPTNPYLRQVESRLQKAGITKEEWETWVNLRNKYLFGKKEPEE